MDAKDAVSAAKSYISETFADEDITDIGLEEPEFLSDKGIWEVTIGFARGNKPAKPTNKSSSPLYKNYYQKTNRRSFKIVRIDQSGHVLALKSHPVESHLTWLGRSLSTRTC